MKEFGKQYKYIMEFIARVRNNETPMIISTDYVVMSKKQYDIISNQVEKPVILETAEEGCTCQNCGEKYKIDFLLPDNVWLKISPTKSEGGLLCGGCIVNKLESLGDYGAFKFIEFDSSLSK